MSQRTFVETTGHLNKAVIPAKARIQLVDFTGLSRVRERRNEGFRGALHCQVAVPNRNDLMSFPTRKGNKLLAHALLLGLSLSLPGPAEAQTLSQLLARARESEPSYLGAKSGIDAAKARVNQAYGALMPQLSASLGVNYNNRQYYTTPPVIPMAEDAYNNNSQQLSLTQPLWHYANVAALKQARFNVSQAEHQLDGAEQELFAKLVADWLDALSSHDNLQAMILQEMALRKQWEIERRSVELGASGRPKAEEARAKYEQARADSKTAEDDVQLKVAALELLVGPLTEFQEFRMTDGAQPSDLSGDTLDHWLSAADEGNPALFAAKAAYDAADAEVVKQRAGYMPTLDASVTYSRNSQAVGGFPGQNGYDIRQTTAGLQLNLPISLGGTQGAKVAEAVAMRDKARLDIEAARRAARQAVKQAWFDWHSAHVRTEAGQLMVKSAELTLLAAQRGKTVGLKMDFDVIQAEQQLRSAEHDLRKALYDQIVAHLKLKAAAGLVTAADVAGLEKLFEPVSPTTPSGKVSTP